MPKSVYTRAYQRLLDELIAQRKAAGLTQQELADAVGRPQSFVSKIERGERRLDLVECLEIARVIGADPQALIATVESEMSARGSR